MSLSLRTGLVSIIEASFGVLGYLIKTLSCSRPYRCKPSVDFVDTGDYTFMLRLRFSNNFIRGCGRGTMGFAEAWSSGMNSNEILGDGFGVRGTVSFGADCNAVIYFVLDVRLGRPRRFI